MSSPAQLLPYAQVMAIMNEKYFHPVGIICFVIMPIKILLEAMILVRIAFRTLNRKAVPPAMQLPAYAALSLLIGQTFNDAKTVYQFAAQHWILGTPCLALSVIWLYCFVWMGLFMAITSVQYMLSIVRPRFLSPSNRFMNAKSLHLPALIALLPAAALTTLGGLSIQHTGYCGFRVDTSARHIIVSIFFMLALAMVLVCYATAIWYLEKKGRKGARPSSWSATQGTIRQSSRISKRATLKLFSYSLLTTLVSIPPIIFPILFNKVHFPSEAYFRTLIAEDVILQSVPILLGMIWILNEGILDRDVGRTCWSFSFSKKSSSVGDSFTESRGNITGVASFPSFPPHPGVNIKASKVPVEVRSAGAVDNRWKVVIKEGNARSMVPQRDSMIEVEKDQDEGDAKRDADAKAEDDVDAMTAARADEITTALSPAPRNSASSGQLKLVTLSELDDNRASWQSEFFDSTLRNENESRNTNDDSRKPTTIPEVDENRSSWQSGIRNGGQSRSTDHESSQEMKAVMISEVDNRRSSWQSGFFHSTLRNDGKSRKKDGEGGPANKGRNDSRA